MTRSGGVVEELREIRRVMEGLVGVMKRVAIGEKGDSKTGRAKRTRLRKREKRGEKRTV